ncbi:MAG: hypothetical protein ABH879_06305 [archaeon]
MMGEHTDKLVAANLVLTVALLGVGAYMIFSEPSVTGHDIYDPLVSQLNQHPELSSYMDQFPRITRLTQADIDNFAANNQPFYANAKNGDYLLEYPGMGVIYDYQNDNIVNFYEQPRAPDNFLQKLLAHAELKGNEGVTPQITLMDRTLLDQAMASDAEFFRAAQPGDYLVQYDGLTVLYRYSTDLIVNVLKPATLPTDFFAKLFSQQGMQAYQNVQPQALAQLTEQSLADLRLQNPDVYDSTVRAGMFAVRYADRFVIFDYTSNRLVKSIALQQEVAQNSGTP